MTTEVAISSSNQKEKEVSIEVRPPGLYGDKWNLVKLLFLYLLQGVPLGFIEAFPIILKSRRYSYNDQAIFSISAWPFTLKILWAPLVDSVYCHAVGRRKMWLVPVHVLLGTCLLFCSFYNEDWLMNVHNLNVIPLSIAWLIINFLAATQDIVVDGWACSMLQKHNIRYASICNATGQSLGSFLGYAIPLLLGSETFCNKWLRFQPKSGGMVTLEECLYFWGIVYIVASTFVCKFKAEIQLPANQTSLGVWNTYKLLWTIMKLPNVKIFGAIFLTAKLGFITVDTTTSMEFMEAGVSESNIVLIGIALYLVKFIVPVTLSKTKNAAKAFDIFMKYIPIRLLHGVAFSLLLYYSPLLISNQSIVQTFYYITLVLTFISSQTFMFIMYVTYLTVISEVSDPNFGGIYMTLLATFANVSLAVNKTIFLWLLDVLTYKQCSNNPQNQCTTSKLTKVCHATEGTCNTVISGYYAEIAICSVLGILWYSIIKKPIARLQSSDKKSWLVFNQQNLKMESP